MAAKNDPGQALEAATSTTQYEVRCLRCNVSFPPGTRRCLHCGGRTGRPPPVTMDMPSPVPDGEPEEEMPGGSAARAGLWAVTAAIAMAGSLFRMCQGG